MTHRPKAFLTHSVQPIPTVWTAASVERLALAGYQENRTVESYGPRCKESVTASLLAIGHQHETPSSETTIRRFSSTALVSRNDGGGNKSID